MNVSQAIDHYGVPKYFNRSRVLERVGPDGYTEDKRPLFLQLFNGLFSHEIDIMKTGASLLR
jgi:hypothetical protein